MANSLTDVINFTPLTHNDHGRKLKESVKKIAIALCDRADAQCEHH
ncbi:hypothetical protein [Escherichia coli ISC7]|uniref:Uncharacterized protein n=1 Tax=Escherichia coli ISC7 TaxID=1432555 RepID=W1EV85_ECOLX|nr:hypothetical protein [Escherichia coli ISC7]